MLDDENNLEIVCLNQMTTIIKYISHFRDKHERHRKVAAEDVGEGNKSKGGIFLVSDNHGDWSRDDAQDGHVVDGHSHQPTVVNLFNLPSERSCWLT